MKNRFLCLIISITGLFLFGTALQAGVDVPKAFSENPSNYLVSVHVDKTGESEKKKPESAVIIEKKHSDTSSDEEDGPADVSNIGRDTIIKKGEEAGDVSVIGGNLIVRGHVTGDADVVGGKIIIEPGGSIDGDASALGGKVDIKPGGKLKGDTIEMAYGFPRYIHSSYERSWHGFTLSWLIKSLVLFVLIPVLIAGLFPRRIDKVAEIAAKKPGESILYGIAGLLLVVPLAVLIVLTLVGIPLLAVEGALYVAALLFGMVGIEIAVARMLGEKLNRPIASLILAAIIGGGLRGLISLIPIFGAFVNFALTLIGVGAVWVTGFGSRDNWWEHRKQRRTARLVSNAESSK